MKKMQTATMQYFNSHKIVKSCVDAVVFVLTVAIMAVIMFQVIPTVIPNGTVANMVYGHSMDPTLHDGQILFTENSPIDRGDIIVAHMPSEAVSQHPEYEGQSIVKRVVGVPGDVIEIRSDNTVLVNHEEVVENYLPAENKSATYSNVASYNQTVLDENEYYVMGDNRGNSYDSRFFGPLSMEDMIGVSSARLNKDTQTVVKTIVLAAIVLLLIWSFVDATLTKVLYELVARTALKNQRNEENECK